MTPHSPATKLWYVTATFPFKSPDTWNSQEMSFLARNFDDVVVLPERLGSGSPPEQLEVNVSWSDGLARHMRLVYPAIWLLLTCTEARAFFLRCLMTLRRKDTWRLRPWWRVLKALGAASFFKKEMRQCSNEMLTVYCFWFTEAVVGAGIAKAALGRPIRIVARAHGYDLYDQERGRQFCALRREQFRYVDTVLAVSEHGRAYLAEEAGEFHEKIAKCYLGFDDPALSVDLAVDRPEEISVLSVSYVHAFKRVPFIYEVVRCLAAEYRQKVRWLHIGGGPGFEELAQLALGDPVKNLDVKLLGSVAPQNVAEVYGSRYFDVFVHASLMEGLPASMIEALAWGIPIVATEAGGIRELVGTDAGRVLDRAARPLEVAEAIVDLRSSGRLMQCRRGARARFEADFRSDRAWDQLLSHLASSKPVGQIDE